MEASTEAGMPAGRRPGRMRRRLVHRLTEPLVLFPLSALVTLLLIWGATFFYVRLLRIEVETHARQSTGQILETYEAQVIRSLGEIERAMNLVTWWREQGHERPIAALTAEELLPSSLVFGVKLLDAQGRMVDGNQAGATENGQLDYLERLLAGEVAEISGHPVAHEGGTTLHFARRLVTAEGVTAGAVVVEVDAAFFVSGYEEAIMGRQGLLALVGPDGSVRVSREGDAVQTDGGGFAALAGEEGIARRVGEGAQARWIASRQLFSFPLAVVVGLSVEEQYGTLRSRARGYYLLAVVASLFCLLGLALVGRLSWHLVRSREREVRIQQAHAERVEYLAYHDNLTGLANRGLFSRLLSQTIAESVRYVRQAAVVYIDLDRFKPINDTLGHEAGDELLKCIAQRLLACVRASDTVARLGGDEFVVLLTGVHGEDEVAGVARKIVAAVGQPLTLVGREVSVTASIGIALCPRDGRDEDTLKRNADAAMYQAKALGRNTFRFYSDRLSTTSLERLNLEVNLRHALERDELRLYFQARRDVQTGRVIGMEALLHWEHPELGVIRPAGFMGIAEDSGAIVAIGRWVLKSACEQSVVLRRHGVRGLCVTVPLTASQFHDERLLEDVRTTLAQSRLEPWLLELAVPEAALTAQPAAARARLQGLREMGVRLAIGDFGAGYDWAAQFGDFHFDSIRIHAPLTRTLARAGDDGFARSVVAAGRSLATVVVAPDVADGGEACTLRERERGRAGAAVQAYGAGEPRPLEQFAALLAGEPVVAAARQQPPPGGRSRAG